MHVFRMPEKRMMRAPKAFSKDSYQASRTRKLLRNADQLQ